MLRECSFLGAIAVALLAQFALSELGAKAMLDDIFSSLATIAEPEREPVRMQTAKNERDINAQQQHSAELLAELLPDADASAVQPDEVRRDSEDVITTDLSMRCGEKLPPESAWSTRGVEIHIRSTYRGEQQGTHQWKYEVTFKNNGVDTVQMLARQWVFVDMSGKPDQIKGPGARGVTPVLGPGDSWSYESGATLQTPTGSMHGSFQFDTLKSKSGAEPLAFSARVARLALSDASGRGVSAPCAEEASESALQPSSVHATRRVIVGANLDYAEQYSKPEESQHQWIYDVQINNAREGPVTVVAHEWRVTTEEEARRGERGRVVLQGNGVGGTMGEKSKPLPAGEAFRVRGLLPATAPRVKVRGHFVIRIGGVEGGETFEAKVGALGATLDGSGLEDWEEEER